MEANEATQTHCYNPVAPTYPVWAYAHGRQHRCQEDPVSLPSSGLEKTPRLFPHHVAQHRPTESETPPFTPQSSRFGSEPPSVEDDVDVWHYAILVLHASYDDDCHRFQICICVPKFIKSGIFCSDMAILRFAIWHPSAILNFRCPIMGSLKSLCIGLTVGRQ